MDARDYFLKLYEHTHYQGKAKRVLDEATAEQYRTVLPQHNSIAWIVWHIARGEDWTVHTILSDGEQLLTRAGWADRMGVQARGFGGGMPRDEMIDLSARIDLGALRGYYDAVADATRDFARRFDFDRLDEPFDIDSRLAGDPEAAGPSASMRTMLRRWNTPRVWLDVMTVVDVCFHIEEAEHVYRLLLPEREFP
jgi:hypothetical protein